MQTPPKIIYAKSFPDRTIEIEYDNGLKGKFNFDFFFEYKGYYIYLKDLPHFLKIQIETNGHNVFWLNETNQEEIEIDPSILYSICSQEKIIHDDKVVFDPSLGKKAWL